MRVRNTFLLSVWGIVLVSVLTSAHIAWAEVRGELSVQSQQFTSEKPESLFSNDDTFSSHLIGEHQGDFFQGKYDFNLGRESNKSYMQVSEAYVGNFKSAPFHYAVGRVKQPWFHAEETWQLGLWQPQFRWNYLRPLSEGLTGIHFQFGGENFQNRTGFSALLFASPLHFPTQIPPIRENRGELVSSSRWFQSPARNVPFSGELTRVDYTLDIPPTAQFIRHQSYGAIAQWGENGFWLKTSYLRKPMPNLAYSYQSFLQIAERREDIRARMILAPGVRHHEVAGVEFGYVQKIWEVTLSQSGDRPLETEVPENWAVQVFDPTRLTSIHTKWKLAHLGEVPLTLGVGYLKITGGNARDLGEALEPGKSIFNDRFLFKDAAQVTLSGSFYRHRNHEFRLSQRWAYEFQQAGVLSQSVIEYLPTKSWRLSIGADILGQTRTERGQGQFFSKYRANDRFYGGLHYVF